MTAHSEAVTVGGLTRADAQRCAELEAQLFDGDDPWPAAAFHRELASAHNHYVGARVGDTLVCVGPPDSIKSGEPSVIIGNNDAARVGDPTNHGGVLVMGCPTVIIGSSPQAEALRTNQPFCEECERKKKEREAKQRRRAGRGA